MSIPYADIVVLALVAGFILLRLRSILGQDVGFDGHSDDQSSPRDFTSKSTLDEQKVLPLHPMSHTVPQEKDEEPADKALLDTLTPQLQDAVADIKKIEPDFNVERFIEGAKSAFEMILRAFNENDKDTLKQLLSQELEEVFIAEAEKRQKADPKMDTTLVSISDVTVLGVTLGQKHAAISLQFTSEQITVERDSKGDIVKGDPSNIERIEDEWTFERDLGARHPNWVITAT